VEIGGFLRQGVDASFGILKRFCGRCEAVLGIFPQGKQLSASRLDGFDLLATLRELFIGFGSLPLDEIATLRRSLDGRIEFEHPLFEGVLLIPQFVSSDFGFLMFAFDASDVRLQRVPLFAE
tara:strand:- start:73 stop:438 length:366 start_codon:yes stop_codon:yes gene_type:complete